MAAPPLVPDDAPTNPIRVADLRRTTRRRTPLIVVGAVVVALIALGSIVVARSTTPAPDSTASGGPTTSTVASAPPPPAPAVVAAGGELFRFTASPGTAEVSADGSVVAVLDDVSTSPGRASTLLTTYDQGTGARLAAAGPDLPEIVDCGVDVVRRPDGSSVVLTRFDTETPANGVQLGSRQAHLAGRDGRTLRPLWDVVLHAGDSNDQQLLVDTQCHGGVPSYLPTADGQFVLNRSFDVSRLVDLATGAVRPVPYAVNVVGNDVVVAVPPPPEPGVDTPVDKTGPSTFDAVRLQSAKDLHVESTITDHTVVPALAGVGAPGRASLTGFVTPSGSDSRFSTASLSGDARILAVREDSRVALLDLPSGRPRATVELAAANPGDGSDDSLAIIPGATPDRDVLLVGLLSGPNAPFPATGFTAYDLAGHRLWSLPDGAARGICAIDRGILLLRGSGLATIDPVTGQQLSVDQGGDCPQVVAGLGVTSHQDSPVSSTAEYTVTVLRRP